MWILSKKINVTELITHRFPLNQVGDAFKIVNEALESLKVIIEPNMVE